MTPGMFRRVSDGAPLDKVLGVPAFEAYAPVNLAPQSRGA
jgi:hypothetical protein